MTEKELESVWEHMLALRDDEGRPLLITLEELQYLADERSGMKEF